MKEALILFRWDDGAFALTGWGLFAFLLFLAALEEIGRKR